MYVQYLGGRGQTGTVVRQVEDPPHTQLEAHKGGQAGWPRKILTSHPSSF